MNHLKTHENRKAAAVTIAEWLPALVAMLNDEELGQLDELVGKELAFRSSIDEDSRKCIERLRGQIHFTRRPQ